MASIIEGYTYDIFISYRQKDNKGDRWVSEFVDALKDELESTFKEEISVYFDINPHDGLLETHDVNASLKEKLKCLVFIPIISRTYCDPKSFAWEHEFKPFIEQASHDQFGLKVKLPNGNVANRVLPVRIHDLDSTDIKLCESVIGGVLRGVEFIYKEAGVNRPLRSREDSPGDNLNKTFYRNQVNKVANAVKEIILGLKAEPTISVKVDAQIRKPLEKVDKEEKKIEKKNPAKLNKRKLFSGVIILTILLIVSILVYSKIFKRNTLEKLRSSGERISVAVMPFQNMTNDTIWNVWQDGIQNELINNLTNSEELKVRQIESITGLLQSKGLTNYTSITPSVASTISQKLDANVLIYGSIKQAGATIRVNAQLIDSKTEEALSSFQIDGTNEKILHITDSLSRMVKNFLIVSKLKKEVFFDLQNNASANSPEAYRYFTYGQKAFLKRDYPTARNWLLKAIAIDSNFYSAMILLPVAYAAQELYEQANKCTLRAYEKREQMPIQQKIFTNWLYAAAFETPYEKIKYINQILEFDDQVPLLYYQLGNDYMELYQYDKASNEFEKALEIYKKWGSKPMWAHNYAALGFAYHKTGQYKKEKKLYQKAEQDFPGDPAIIYRQAILSLTEGDTIAANRYIKQYRSVRKENSSSEAAVTSSLAAIYSEAGIPNIAEEYYRQALSLEPDSPVRLNRLAFFLIDKDRNINQGLVLVDKALALSPDKYSYLDCKGWGLFKLGKYQEALDILQKSWDLRRQNAVYDHEAYIHLEKAKKAVARQK
jgi:TolB-like protein/Tfp pilus assembly protein PilF